MAKFRKRPVVIEAIQWDGTQESFHQIYDWAKGDLPITEAPVTSDGCYDSGDDVTKLWIDTREGSMRASVGDWIIRGVQGEFYACKPDIFEQTYEPAGEDE